MSSPDQYSTQPPNGPHDDELDQLLTWGIMDQYGSAKAPDGIWQRIRCELKSNQHSRHRPVRTSRWRTASLAQALAIASVLVVVGLSLSPALQWPTYLRGSSESADVATRTPPAFQQPESEPFLADEGLLSGLVARRIASERTQQLMVMAKDTSPKFDPILKYRRDWQGAGSQTSE